MCLSCGAFSLQHVKARNRSSLAENDRIKTISGGSLNLSEKIPETSEETYKVVLKSSSRRSEKEDVTLQVAVSFVPVKPATPAGGSEETEASLEGDMLRQSIDLGAQTFSLEDPEVCY